MDLFSSNSTLKNKIALNSRIDRSIADLPYNLTLTNSLIKGKKGFTGIRISKYGSSSNYIIMEFLTPQIKYFQVAHPTFKAKIRPEIFQEPRITILPRTKIKADLGSFRLGLVSYDFITQEWDALDGIEQTLIINAYGHDLWDADKILVKYLSNSNFDLPNYMNSSPKPTWMAIINEYKILRERSLTQKCEQEEIDIFNAFKLFHEDVSQPDTLWNRINIESPEFARAMIVDLYNRFSGKFRGLGLSLSESSSWNNIITDSTESKKVIGNILEYSGPASHELLKKSDEIHDLINDPRQIKHYDEFTVDSISANRELLTSRRNTKFQETYATIFQQSLLDLERILLLDDYSSTFLWPKRMGTKNDRIGLITSKPNDRWTSQLIKDAKRKYNDMLKQIWGSKNNIKKPIRLTKQEYEEVAIGFMNLVKPGDYYMDSFKTHSEYKKKRKNGLTLDDLSLARPGTVDMAGIKLTLKNNSLSPQVVVTNVELLLNSLKKYIFTSEGAAGSSMIKNLPAFESPELWASFLGRCYYVDHTTRAYGPVPLYNEITDPPLRFTVDMRKIHNIMFNLDKLLLKKDSNGSPIYGTNGGINPKMIRNSLANEGVWLYYMVLLENAIESGRPWQSIQEARKDPEFLKSVNIWKNTSLIKNPDGSGSHILFKDFGEKPFWSIFPNFEGSRYKSIAEYIAYHINYKKIANMHAKTDETGEILFYYFRASQYENSFLNMNWNGPSSKLPYYLPTNQTNNFIGLRDTLLEVKNQFSNNLFDADWINWSLKNLPNSNERSIYLWLRFMDIISKLMVEDSSE